MLKDEAIAIARCVPRESGLSRNCNEEEQMNLRITVMLSSRNIHVAPTLGAETQKQIGQGPYF